MSRIHGLQHIKSLSAPDLAYDDQLRTHTQRGFDQVSYGDLTAPRSVGVPGLQAHQIVDAGDLQLRRILYGDDAFIPRDKVGHRIEECGFA